VATYEGWHIEFGIHARKRMEERHVEEKDVLAVVHDPDDVQVDTRHRGRLLSRYLADWDRMLVVAIEERPTESVLLVKTVLWSEAK
jgi:hypothetical protein